MRRYCLAVAAAKFDIQILFTVAMSNHHTLASTMKRQLSSLHRALPQALRKVPERIRAAAGKTFGPLRKPRRPSSGTGRHRRKDVYALTNPSKMGSSKGLTTGQVSSLAALQHGKTLTATRQSISSAKTGTCPRRLNSRCPSSGGGDSRARRLQKRVMDRIGSVEETPQLNAAIEEPTSGQKGGPRAETHGRPGATSHTASLILRLRHAASEPN